MIESPPRFGYVHLVERLARLAGEVSSPEEMDRREVLQKLSRELGAEESLLLRRGFDKAYRRIVEGV